jgi:2-polyprenyl-6-methoxyphenol hydroxylase-like FAD-dependent oxidoreductase
MTPFAGIGVNLALVDSLDLSHAIHSCILQKLDWTTGLRQFEKKMLARSHIAAAKTYRNLTILFGGNSLEELVRKLGESMRAEAGSH